MLILAAVLVVTLQRRIPPALMKDVRVGISARHIASPDERIAASLAVRYGPMSDPANHQKAFMGFFDVEHKGVKPTATSL